MAKLNIEKQIKLFFIDEADEVSEGFVVGKYLDLDDSWYSGYYYQLTQNDYNSSIVIRKEEDVFQSREGAEIKLAYLQAEEKKREERVKLERLEKSIQDVKDFLAKKEELSFNINSLDLAKEEIAKIKEKYKTEPEF